MPLFHYATSINDFLQENNYIFIYFIGNKKYNSVLLNVEIARELC